MPHAPRCYWIGVPWVAHTCHRPSRCAGRALKHSGDRTEIIARGTQHAAVTESVNVRRSRTFALPLLILMHRNSAHVRTARGVRRTLPCALLVSVALSCGGSDAPTASERPSLSILAGAQQTDTINVWLPQAVTVEVRDSTGNPSFGRIVRFTALRLASSGAFVNVSSLDRQNVGVSTVIQTDSRGRASARVYLLQVAGTAAVEVSVPELGVADTVLFEIRHGSPAVLTMLPRDTMVLPNATFALRSGVTDLYANPIDDAKPTYSATGISVSSAGQVTAGSTFALGNIVAGYGTLTATASVSVLRQLPIVANNGGKVVLMNTDGTGENVLDPTADYSVSPHSVTSTRSVVYYHGDSYINSKVWIVEPGGTPRQLLPAAAGFEAWPRLSPDGGWVYFVRNNKSLWRAHLDGSALDSLGKVNTTALNRAPTISPDGRTVAVQEGAGVKIIDVATKAATIVTAPCGLPHYSPDGQSFACVNSRALVVMKTDGTGARTVAPPFFTYYDQWEELSGPDWTADGKWIMTFVAGRGVVMFDVATGAAVPLPRGYPQSSFVR